MVDAADSKSATCKGVGVQVPFPVFIVLLFIESCKGRSTFAALGNCLSKKTSVPIRG